MTKVVACFGHKYEPDWMIKEVIENLSPWVDDFAIFDSRDRDELWIHEGEYRRILREMAKKKKADYILITSPDERWEKDAGKKIRPLINGHRKKVIYEFDLRELFFTDRYRTDGIWGNKIRRRLYPLLPGQTMMYQPIQCSSVPQNPEYDIKHVDVNIYHLKMIERENRAWRTEVFKILDEDRKYQDIGYDYLMDEYGAVLEDVPKGREYHPKYRKFIFKVPPKYMTKNGKCFVCGGDICASGS